MTRRVDNLLYLDLLRYRRDILYWLLSYLWRILIPLPSMAFPVLLLLRRLISHLLYNYFLFFDTRRDYILLSLVVLVRLFLLRVFLGASSRIPSIIGRLLFIIILMALHIFWLLVLLLLIIVLLGMLFHLPLAPGHFLAISALITEVPLKVCCFLLLTHSFFDVLLELGFHLRVKSFLLAALLLICLHVVIPIPIRRLLPIRARNMPIITLRDIL